MDVKRYIDSAKNRIQSVPDKWSGNNYYLRNRVTEIALKMMYEDAENWREFYEYFTPDIAKCQRRADHYGVKIGDPIIINGVQKYRKKNRVDFDRQCAIYMRKIREVIPVDLEIYVPELYQSRMRPKRVDEVQWTKWESCNKGAYDSIMQAPVFRGWEHQARILYKKL